MEISVTQTSNGFSQSE